MAERFNESLQNLLYVTGSKGNSQERINSFLVNLAQSGSALEEQLRTIICAVFDDSAQQREVGMMSSAVCKQLIGEVVSRFANFPADIVKGVGEFFLEKSKFKLMSYEEHVTAACYTIAGVYENEKQHVKAADVLVKIPLDGQKYESILSADC